MTVAGDFSPPVAALIAGAQALLGIHAAPPPLTDADLIALPDLAQRHGLMRLGLQVLDTARVPASHPARAAIVSRLRVQAGVALRQQAELGLIVQRFERTGLAVVSMRGVAFSAWLYGDATFRRSTDLDLLVRQADRNAARALLGQIGYAPMMTPSAAAFIYAGAGCWPLTRAEGVPVDLHWRTLGRRFPRAVNAAAVVDERVTLPLGAATVPVPRPSHAALIALVHTAKHVWYSLESVLAIATLSQRRDVDWGEVRRLAVAGGVESAAAAGLRLSADILDVPIVHAFADLADLPSVRRAAAHGRMALLLAPGAFPDGSAERKAHRDWLRGSVARLRYDLLRVLEPTYAEWVAVRLTGPLVPLYLPLRLTRLALREMTRRQDRPPHQRQ